MHSPGPSQIICWFLLNFSGSGTKLFRGNQYYIWLWEIGTAVFRQPRVFSCTEKQLQWWHWEQAEDEDKIKHLFMATFPLLSVTPVSVWDRIVPQCVPMWWTWVSPFQGLQSSRSLLALHDKSWEIIRFTQLQFREYTNTKRKCLWLLFCARIPLLSHICSLSHSCTSTVQVVWL